MNAIKRFFLRLLILLIAAGMVGAMLVLFINSRVKHSTEDQILYLIQGETEISALGQESLKDFGADCALVLGCGIGWVCGFTGSGGGILMLTVFTLVLGYNLKVAVGTSTMIMSLVALTGAVSHVSLGAQLFPLPMAIVVASCLLGAVVSAKFANRCEIRRLNRIVGIVLILLGAVTILIKLL